MREGSRDRVLPVVLSLLFHGGLAALLVFGWWQWRSSRPLPLPQPLAIEATVVTEQRPVAAPAPVATPQPAAEPAPQPDHDAEEAAAKARAAQQQAEQAQAEKARTEREQAARTAREQAEREAAAREQAAREAAEKEQAARAAADKQRKDTQRRQVEAELRNSLEAESRQNTARLSSAKSAYMAMIRERIQRNWIKPPSAHAGLDCVVKVTQVSGGTVTGVNIGACNGDAAVKSSIQDAVYRASPLPEPADPAVFDSDLVFNFRPNE
jgi:colicin import membrane protein